MSTVKAADFQHKDSVVANLSLNSGGGVSVYGVGDVSSALAAKAPLSVSINAQAGSYTLVLADAGKVVEIGSASGSTLTVPTNASVAFPVGTSILIVQTGAGQITVAGAGGVAVNATPGLKLYGQWSSALLVKRATDTWLLTGDTAA